MVIIEDRAASVLARLRNKSKKSQISFQQCLQLFIQEEFLRKLSISGYRNNLILKGGLFIYIRTNFESRATIDVDFLLNGYPNSIQKIEKLIQKIVSSDTGNDFIWMRIQGIEEITSQREYHGTRVRIIGKIKNVQIPFHIDIGVGDIVIPETENRVVQTQLPDFNCPSIKTYSLESTIAEKLDAILQRFELTSRMKDFYDIYYISKTFCFDGVLLQTAILKTLEQRKTLFNEKSFERIRHLSENEDMQKRWKNFSKKVNRCSLDFSFVIQAIQHFLGPLFESILAKEEWQKEWDPNYSEWIGT